MRMHFMDKFIKIMLVSSAQVNKGLYCLVWICRKVLPLSSFNDNYNVVDKVGKIYNAIVYIGALIYSYERLVEDLEEISEEAQCVRLFQISRTAQIGDCGSLTSSIICSIIALSRFRM